MKLKLLRRLILFIFTVVLLPHSIAFGRTLDSWSDIDAYKPAPILFLHGFATGAPESWDKVMNGLEDTKGLKEYFNKYTPVTSNLDLSIPYLERIAFNDPNGSIDTYPPGKLNLDGNSDGWADKISKRIDVLLPIYRFKDAYLKFNFICHSMGGLAAREYLTNYKYSNSYLNIDKVITIGTPHAGTPIANVKKIEDAITHENKYVWEVPYFGKIQAIREASEDNERIKLVRGAYRVEPEGEAVKDMAIGSPFLMALNNRPFPNNIKKFAIYGEANSENFQQLNGWFFSQYYPVNEHFTCGDGIVPRDSQIGYDIMSDYPYTASWVWKPEKIERVEADHINELESKKTVQALLQFFDSTPPEFEITSPDPTKTTEIYATSIHIQGKVFKEYLPADSKLTINVERQEGGYTAPPQTSFLKPSDLWIPNNPDWPVAEFDETITFPGNGTYKISCQVKNPAGITSDIKEFLVKVTIFPGTNIIVHCHNPEGKEINSISGVGNAAKIYDGDTFLANGATNSSTHNIPIQLNAGNHQIKVVFNGMTLTENINLAEGETKILVFQFERVEVNMIQLIKDIASIDYSISNIDYFEYSTSGMGYNYQPGNGWTIYRGIGIGAGYWWGNINWESKIFYDVYSCKGSFSCQASLTAYGIWPYYYCKLGHGVNIQNSSWNLPSFLPISNFINWYSQSITHGYYPTLMADDKLMTSPFYFNVNDYRLYLLPANKNYNTLTIEISIIHGRDTGWGSGTPESPFIYNDNYSAEQSASLDAFKISSVPYDLLGDAI